MSVVMRCQLAVASGTDGLSDLGEKVANEHDARIVGQRVTRCAPGIRRIQLAVDEKLEQIRLAGQHDARMVWRLPIEPVARPGPEQPHPGGRTADRAFEIGPEELTPIARLI